jgi:hypothetical protein
METQYIDLLFLELSQITKAKTAKELILERERDEARVCLREAIRLADGYGELTDKAPKRWRKAAGIAANAGIERPMKPQKGRSK